MDAAWGVSGLSLRSLQFFAIVLTALAIVPGGAHLAEMPNKMALGQDNYFVVQQIYDGWALFGIVLIGALVANFAHALMLGRSGQRYGFALMAAILGAVNLVIFFAWTFPVNQATHNWDAIPANWSSLRIQWEYSHALNAIVMFAAFVCVTLAVLRQRSPRP